MTIELKGYNPEHLDELARLVAIAGNNTTGLDASTGRNGSTPTLSAAGARA